MTLTQRETVSRIRAIRDEFDFDAFTDDLEPREYPVRHNGKWYRLREADEPTALQYENATFRALKANNEGNVIGVDGLADLEAILVGGCLWNLENPQDKNSRHTTQVGYGALLEPGAWPHRIIAPLFKRAKQMSGLEKDMSVSQIQFEIERLEKLRKKKLFGDVQEAIDQKKESNGTPVTSG